MNIINKIDEYIFNNPKDVLHIRDDHKACIKDFLGKPNKTTAKKLFKFVGEIQKNNKIYDRLSELVKYEESLAAIIPEQKDHYFHSASVYVLGLALYNKMPSLRKAIKVERLNGCENEEYKQKTSFLLSWSVAACLHDIGYPFELAIKSFNKLTDQYYTKERKYLKIDKAIINDKLILTPFGDNMKYYELGLY